MGTSVTETGTRVMDKKGTGLLYAWLFFAVSSLVFAGIFAFLVVMARTPVVHNLLPGTDYVRIALVGHVVLSFVIWFLAFKGTLWTLTGIVLLRTGPFSRSAGWAGYLLSVAGTMCVIISSVAGLGTPQFINYIPVLTHPVFYTGLLLLASGIVITLFNTFLSIWKAWSERTYEGVMPLFTFGMAVSGIAVLSAIACFGLSYYFQVIALQENMSLDLESLFWGGGHVLQFANTIAMVTVWIFLTSLVFKKLPVNEWYAKLLYAVYLIFILPAPAIYLIYETSSHESRNAFTALMEYGLGPSTAIFALAILITVGSKMGRKLPWNSPAGSKMGKRLPWDRPEFSSLIISMMLFALGGLISLNIYGYNTKIPSHYHGVIGAVTIAFMGLTNYVLSLLRRDAYSRRIATIQPYVYGIGQGLFVIGMFWAGSHGVARKTFGAAQNLDNIAKVLGMATVGIGGVIAIIGGILFIINIMPALIRNETILPLWDTKEQENLA